MAVTDLRTLIDDGTDVTNWEDLTGSATGNANSDTAPPGASTSISDKISNAVGGLLYNTGATGNFAAGDHLYLWYTLLFGAPDTIAGGGIRIRVTGATVTDWAEVNIDGSDSGKSGWQLAVVSLDAILANPDATNGTPPTAAQVQRVGTVFDMVTMVSGNNDNVAVQGIWRSPSANVAAYRIDGGSDASPNTWQDLVDHSLNNGLGIVVEEPNGAISVRAPIVFGPDPGGGSPNAVSTFEDTGIVLAWDISTGLIEPDFYKLTVEAGTGDVRVTAGTKLGTGETAVGVNGWTIVTGGPKWRLDFEDVDQDDIQLFGCSFSGSGPLSINDPAVEVLSCVFSNCDTIEMTGGVASGQTMLSNFFSGAPGPRAQVVFTSGVTPDDGQFDFNTFANMSWFAIEIPSSTAAFDLRGVSFSGNGTDRDVLLSHTTGDIQLNILETGDTPGVTNGSTITVTMTGACDLIAVTAGTWAEALGTETNDLSAQGVPLVTQTTASLAVDDDTFALAAVSPATKSGPNSSTLDYTGTSDQYSDSYFLEIPSHGGGMSLRLGADEVTPAAATRTGFPVASHVEEEGVQGIVHVDAAAGGTSVVSLDATNGPLGVREMRPWETIEDSSTLTFSYGAGDSTDNARFVYVAIVALDGTAANTLVSGVDLNRDGGTTALSARTTSFPIQDDNVGTTGKSLELHVFDYDVDTAGQNLDQGTFDVNNNVTVTITVRDTATDPIEGVSVGVFRQDNGAQIVNELTNASGVASDSFAYVSDTNIDIEVRSSSGTPAYFPIETTGTITSSGFSLTVTMQEDDIIDC